MKNKGSGRGMFKAHLKVFETFFYPVQAPVFNETLQIKRGQKKFE